MKYNISSSLCMVAVLGVVFCCISGARAGSMSLSGLSSDPNISAAELGATVDFQLTSTDLSTDPIITVTVSNTSLAQITELLFNIPDSVKSVSLTTNPQGRWQVTGLSDSHSVAGFGLFDLLLDDIPGQPTVKISSGAVDPTIFGIQLFDGDGSITDAYFYNGSESTTITGGETAVVVAAFFTNVSEQGDAYGASLAMPEPGTLALLAFSMFMVGVFRCRLC